MNSGLRRAGQALARLYPMGLSLFWKAPLLLALVVLPEFAQHVVEIRLGMFDSLDAFRSLQLDATRMAFGAVKVAGLLLAMLAAARFGWVQDHGGRWWDLRGIAWPRLALGAILFFGVGSLPELLKGRMDDSLHLWVGGLWAVLLLPGLFMLLAGLFGDRATPTASMWRRAWPWLMLTVLLVVIGFGPSAWLHQMNHQWAMGAPPAFVWALMIFDSLLVGLLAGLTGTALFLGYRAFAQHIGDGRTPGNAGA